MSQNKHPFQAVIFDMDGTVLDTAGDLQDSLNVAFRACGYTRAFSVEEVKGFFGSGIREAIIRALALIRSEEKKSTDDRKATENVSEGHSEDASADENEIERIQVIFSEYYPEHCAIETGPYDGILELLKALQSEGIRTAVVSNKIDPAVQELSEDCFAGLFDFAIGESPAHRRKPAPDMVLAALQALDAENEDAVYIGDSEVDMETAQNSGLSCISVAWGFRSAAFLEQRGARLVFSVKELQHLLIPERKED